MTEILAENYTLKVILPEGASSIKVHLPFAVDSLDESLYFSTLDYIGRPQLTIKKTNVISSLHKESFQVSYEMSANALLIEPLYVIAFFFTCFLSAIIYTRVDLSFRDEKKKVKTQ
jgi:oligosaccharyltransferase complex subunit alpha (ribophorin I)